MAKTSFAEIINSSRVMLTGLQANTEAVGKRGIDAEFITNLQNAINASDMLNSEQETLKASLKAKTAELDTKIAGLKNLMSEAKKVVKLAIDKVRWLEFGISDKH
ncbi:MAG: hypothetical protein ABIJ12_06995 [bacterium]